MAPVTATARQDGHPLPFTPAGPEDRPEPVSPTRSRPTAHPARQRPRSHPCRFSRATDFIRVRVKLALRGSLTGSARCRELSGPMQSARSTVRDSVVPAPAPAPLNQRRPCCLSRRRDGHEPPSTPEPSERRPEPPFPTRALLTAHPVHPNRVPIPAASLAGPRLAPCPGDSPGRPWATPNPGPSRGARSGPLASNTHARAQPLALLGSARGHSRCPC